ncbi:MAG: HlyD family efflux transporter periplasmic adaptor subunit [Saprospirales bacterium]|nr:HlyD family efflux transporter periplasmic adaptor subunit [Saprospirales bacterium]
MDRKIEKKKWGWQRMTIGVIVIVLIAYLGQRIMQDAGASRLNVETDRLLMDTVHRGVFQEFIPVTGVVLPIRSVVIAASEGGKVEEKFVEDGAMLKGGQPILRLSNPDLQLNYLNQEATIVNQINQIQNMALLRDQQSLNLRETMLDVEYRIELLGNRLARNRLLMDGGAISKVELEELEAEHNSLLRRKVLLAKTIHKDSLSTVIQEQQMENSLDLMRRNLDIARQSLDNLVVKAPIDGQLSGLNSELGESISRGIQIAQIDDLRNYKIRVRIDEFYISRIFPDQEGTFLYAGKDYRLQIKKIYPQVANGAFEADMAFVSEFPTSIKRGQTLSVKLELSAEEEATLLARGGFYQKTGGNWVYIIDPATGNGVKKEIRLGRQNPNFYEVLEGLKEGEVVVTSSYDTFGDKDELILK